MSAGNKFNANELYIADLAETVTGLPIEEGDLRLGFLSELGHRGLGHLDGARSTGSVLALLVELLLLLLRCFLLLLSAFLRNYLFPFPHLLLVRVDLGLASLVNTLLVLTFLLPFEHHFLLLLHGLEIILPAWSLLLPEVHFILGAKTVVAVVVGALLPTLSGLALLLVDLLLYSLFVVRIQRVLLVVLLLHGIRLLLLHHLIQILLLIILVVNLLSQVPHLLPAASIIMLFQRHQAFAVSINLSFVGVFHQMM